MGKDSAAEACFHFSFSAENAQPVLSLYEFLCQQCRLTIEKKKKRPRALAHENEFSLETPEWRGVLPSETSTVLSRYFAERSSELGGDFLAYVIRQSGRLTQETDEPYPPESAAHVVSALLRQSFRQFDFRTYPFGPIRLKPSRTYDFVQATPNAEGLHTPSQLKTLSLADDSDWQKTKENIEAFGQESGLFADLLVKSLGPSAGDPFQIYVDNGAVSSNLIDVGYGVSQILPIIVDLTDNPERNWMYLLQHPEAHLHPRAQAQLGDFLCAVATKSQSSVMVETHSDYLVDRVRMLIRERKISPETVSLLFFERTGASVRIRELPIDETGDFGEAPQAYRAFFMAEQMRQLGL